MLPARDELPGLLAGLAFGGIFISASGLVLLGLAPTPEIPPDTPVGAFMAAFGPTGYMTFVKVLELLGGILVLLPRTRLLGLLVLVPILVNILAFHQLVAGDGIFQPMLLALVALAGFLIWVERRAVAVWLRPRPRV
jgi:hypothetical protein